MTTQERLYAGVARANITPPVGIQLSGFAGRGPSVGHGEELTATAVVLREGPTKVAIVALDLLFLQAAYVQRVAAEIERRTRIPAAHVLLCCSHTHYGPETGGYEGDPATSDVAAYMADLKFQAAGAVQEANANLKPARALIGHGASEIGVNRRERRPDGQIILGQNLEGFIDRELTVLRLDRPSGEPVAALTNFPCHGVSQSHLGRLISPDFPGPMREVLEESTDAKALYLQGACGNINPIRMIEGLQTPRTLGTMLGAAAVLAYQSATPIGTAPLRVAGQQAKLPAKMPGSLQEARKAVATLEAELEHLQATKGHEGSRHWAQWRLSGARAQLESLERGKPLPPIVADMTAIGLGDLGIAAAPGEIFCEIGCAVRSASPFPHTMFLGYTNGSIGYVPIPEAYPEGGYEVTHASRVGPEAAGIVTDTAGALLRKVRGGRKG